MQLVELFSRFNELQSVYGSLDLTAIYGAGEINNPNICLIFMNPTSKNISSTKSWKGIKAPWLGTKNVWKLLFKLGLFKNKSVLRQIEAMKPAQWTATFSEELYTEIANESLYITNIAKCTQDSAKPLSDFIYKQYLPLMLEELDLVRPKIVIALGNQVSSILLGKPISVSNYIKKEYENLILPNGQSVKVFPCYYPIGQGTPNMQKAVVRINKILALSQNLAS